MWTFHASSLEGNQEDYAQKNGRAYIVARYSPGGNFHYAGRKVKWYKRNVQREGTEQLSGRHDPYQSIVLP